MTTPSGCLSCGGTNVEDAPDHDRFYKCQDCGALIAQADTRGDLCGDG